jgi:hypothetical protein
MKKCVILVAVLGLFIVGGGLSAGWLRAQAQSSKASNVTSVEQMNGTAGTVDGYIRDTACLYRNRDSKGTSSDPEACLIPCIKAGAPIGLLADDGTLYNMISGKLPDTDERQKLLPYVGKHLKASGRVFERGGSHAIAIEKIEVIGE